ncbi:acetylneuraminic acid synthetase [Marinomonas sp. TW1]|nr:acetylneuraminic acid synthetase [Marinomonas sp. TW1]
MIINRRISAYIVPLFSSVRHALEKLESSKTKVLFIVDEYNKLLGSFTDGDFRRKVIESEGVSLQTPIADLMNRACFSVPLDVDNSIIEDFLKQKKTAVPIIDESGHLIAVAALGSQFIEIDGRRISAEDPSYLIAEIGNNHQGSIEMAKQLVDLAVEANVDCVKFQMRTMSSLYGEGGKNTSSGEDLGAEYTLDLLSRFQLKDEELYEIFDYCKSQGVTPLCTPWDMDSLAKLEHYGLPGYKVASADFTNYQLLEAIAATGKPMICSTGMSTEDEINKTVQFLQRKKAAFILLHCNSTYPTPFKDVNLKYLPTLKSKTNGLVGYSGHERGWAVTIAAVTLGACVIEKHFTLDRNLEGNDHKVSLLPDELVSMVNDIRAVEESMGRSDARELTQGELINREVLAKSVAAKRNIQKGDLISAKDLLIKGPGKGLQPNRMSELIGSVCIRDVEEGALFYDSDLDGMVEKKAQYAFNRPVGIPVRYHDFQELCKDVELDFVEFHLSYKDLEVKLANFIPEVSTLGLAIHAPELFKGDHLLDLASYDFDYREHSIKELQKVVDHSNEVKKRFPKTQSPALVLNAGGWNSEGFLTPEQVTEKYQLLAQSLEKINFTGVTLAIQTMPPFPWHFGGQSYHNLFVSADEIVAFCEATGFKVCLDVSHTMMACNYYGWDLYEFIEKISPYVVHMHIVDAKGSDGEGITVGEGDVDFKKLGRLLDKSLPNVQFIPEVWQGHKNAGEGFWQALNYLEKAFNI